MRNIVVALDGSESARLALGWAQELAKTSDAPLFHLVHTCQMPLAAIEAGGGSLVSSEYQQGQELLEQAAAELSTERVKLHLLDGDPAAAILDVAERVDADLIAVGRRGRGHIASMLLGSVSLEVVHQGKVPVLVTHNAPPRTVQKVLVGIDGSDHSIRSLGVAARVAPPDAEITTFHVMHIDPETAAFFVKENMSLDASVDQTTKEVVMRTAQLAGVPMGRIRVMGGIGSAADQVVMEYRMGNYDLAVVGARGRGALPEILLGNVSERVLRLASGPVLVVK